ncbi:MAG TPA: nucleoside-diphosphate kinase [Candidatus Thermoplasmatota archaeon]|nr:nucleoside-diphosphate kinase [Candidatus Thermoplasmatota archaeon]
MERTFAMVKPDGVQRNLTGEIVRRYEARGLKVVGMKLMMVPRTMAEAHYAEHKGKPFYNGLVEYITSGPVVALCLEGKNAVAVVRAMNGATKPWDALPGTIRGDFALDIGRNVVHGSDSVESAKRELEIYFTKDELVTWTPAASKWVTE